MSAKLENHWPDPDLGAHARTLRDIARRLDTSKVSKLKSVMNDRRGMGTELEEIHSDTLEVADQLDALSRPIVVTHPEEGK